VVVGSIEMSPNAAQPTEACVMLKPVACRALGVASEGHSRGVKVTFCQGQRSLAHEWANGSSPRD
jgi:hypothetical protein